MTRAASSAIHYRRRGAGEPLVLLHGIGSSAGAWDPVADDLAETYEVVPLDLPGFGGSPLGDLTPSVSGYADRLEALFAELDLVRPHVAGHSLGAAIALELGRRGAARSVTALAPTFWRRSGLAWCEALLGAMRRITPRTRPVLPGLLRLPLARSVLFAVFYGHPGRIPVTDLIAGADAFLTGDGFHAALEQFADQRPGRRAHLDNIPVTVVWGARDRLLPRRTQARRAGRLLPNAQHVVLPGAGHMLIGDDPVGCLMLLRRQWRDRPDEIDPPPPPAISTATADRDHLIGEPT